MAGYDASIRVSTKIDTSQMQRLQIQIDKATDKVDVLAAKYDEIRNKKIPTDDYLILEQRLQNAKFVLDSFVEEENKMIANKKDFGVPWDNLIHKEEEAQLKIEAIQAEMQKLEDAGKAFTIGNNSEEIADVGHKLAIARAELEALITKQEELYAKQVKNEASTNKLANTHVELQAVNLKSQDLAAGFSQAAKSGKKFFSVIQNGTKKSKGLLSTMSARLKGLALSLLVFNWISKGFNALVSSMREGFKNLAKYSKDYNAAMSAMKSECAQLKNSLAAAFEPVANAIIPYITQLVSWLNVAADALARFLAALSGKSTYTRAKKQVIDYAKSLDTASKAAKGALAAFDDINVLQQDNSGSAGAGGELVGADAFETVTIELSPFLDKLKDSIANGDWYGVGKLLGEKFNEVLGNVHWYDLGNKAADKVNDFFETIKGFLDEYDSNEVSSAISDTIIGFFENVDWELVVSTCARLLWEAFKTFAGTFFNIGTWINELITGEEYDLNLEETIDYIIDSFKKGDWKDGLKLWWQDIKAAGTEFLSSTMVQWGTDMLKKAKESAEKLKKKIEEYWDNLKSKMAEKRTEILEKASEFARNLVEIFVGLACDIAKIAFGIVQSIASIFDASSKMGTIKVTGSTPSVNQSKVPRLAEGAVLRGGNPFMAILGDQPAGQTNIEAPAGLIKDMVIDGLAEAGGIGGQNITIKFEGSLAELGRVLKPVIDVENARIGKNFRKNIGGYYG